MMKKVLLPCVLLLLSPVFVYSEETVLFEDSFKDKLQDGWSWLREVPEDWRIKDGALEIKMEPMPAGGARNALYRKAPKKAEGDFVITLELVPSQSYTAQFQQAGIYWMQNNDVKFKFVKELIDGELYVFPGKVPLETEHVVLRVRIVGSKAIAEFQPEGKGEFRQAAEATIPERNDDTDRIGIQCWHGPADKDAWTRFLHFAITKPQ